MKELFLSNEPIDADGRVYLVDRGLSIPVCEQNCIASADGKIYFAFTRDGEIVRTKYRSMTDKKDTKFDHCDDKDFKMPFFCQFKCPTSDYLIITEGEFDCIALKQLGAINVCSLPNGAGSLEKAFRENYEFLQQFSTIYIATDNDKAGDEAAKKAMALIPSRYRRISFSPSKDANDWVKKNRDIEHEELVRKFGVILQNAKKIESDRITHMKDLPDSFYEKINLGISTGWPSMNMILGGLRTGEVSVISAETAAGKTTFTTNLSKNIAERGCGVWLNTYESDPRVIHRKMAGLVLKKHMKFNAFTDAEKREYKLWIENKKCYINNVNKRVDLIQLRNDIELASLVYEVKYILLDHLDYIYINDSRSQKNSERENLDIIIQEIHCLAMEFNVGILLVAHPKQMAAGREVTMNDLKGSSSIKQYADNIIILTRMDRIDSKDKRLKVRIWKNRLCGYESAFFLDYKEDIDGYVESLIQV